MPLGEVRDLYCSMGESFTTSPGLKFKDEGGERPGFFLN